MKNVFKDQAMDKMIEELTWINKELQAINSYRAKDQQVNLDEVQNKVSVLSNRWEDLRSGSDADIKILSDEVEAYILSVNNMIGSLS